MKSNLKRVLCVFLAALMLLTSYPNTNIANAAVDNTYLYTNSRYEYSNYVEYFNSALYTEANNAGRIPTLPSGQKYPISISVGGKTLYLNYKLYKQKNLFVYGNYASVADNYFKCGYQLHNDLGELLPDLYYGNGYYLKPNGQECRGLYQNPETHGPNCTKHTNGTVRGEWKYFGYDVNGNKFSNMWMINVATETKFAERNWQMEPWSEALKAETGLTYGISTYNQGAYGHNDGRVRDTTRKWIASTITSMDGYDKAGIPTRNPAYPSGRSFDVYRFAYVQSPPTLQQSGSAKMFHKFSSTGKMWYQTFSIPKLESIKEYLPVNANITLASNLSNVPNDSKADNERYDMEFAVEGILRDDVREDTGTAPAGWTPYHEDAVAKVAKYTRHDLFKWELTINIPSLGISQTVPVAKNGTNKAKTNFKLNTTVKKIKALPKDANGKYIINVTAKAVPIYLDNKASTKIGNDSKNYTVGKTELPPPEPPERRSIEVSFPTLNIDNYIGLNAFEGVPFDDVSENTDMQEVESIEMYVNGQPVDHDTFFSGQYVFDPPTGKNNYFAEVITKYNLNKDNIVMEGLTDEEKALLMGGKNLQYITTDVVAVFPTTPNAQFNISSTTWKENRIINVTNTSATANIHIVTDKYPITQYRWTYGGDTTKLRYGTNTDLAKQLQYKQAGIYSVTIECKNTLGKWSEPYTVDFQVLEDIAPNIEINLDSSVITRNEELSAWHYDVNSTDGDRVAIAKIELWYDSDNNGTLETKKQEWNGLGTNGICELEDFPKYTPTQLGYYKYKIYAKDEFVGVAGQDTLSQHVVTSDKKERTYEVEFWVDNYQPLSDLYIDVAINRPNIDLYIMRDKNTTQDRQTYISENKVTMENQLLGRNIIPSINIWDMKTYEYSTSASTSRNTGTSYPDYSVYYESSGYSGTLTRDSVTNNSWSRDEGYYINVTKSKTVSDHITGTVTITYLYSTGTWYYQGSSGSINNDYPHSYGPDSDGYSGTIYQNGSGYITSSSGSPPSKPKHGDTYTVTEYWRVDGSGTATKTVQEWKSNIVYYDDYTGYYSGTIYKYVRQPYTDPWRSSSNKYILYLSDNNISDLTDFNSVKSKADAKIILAGKPEIKAQCPTHAKFIDTTGKTTQAIMDEVIEYIGNETPGIENLYVLPNQVFTLQYGENDLEGDTIVEKQFLQIQNSNYFDNPTGQEPSTPTTYSDSSTFWKTTAPTKFTNVGKYSIFRRVKDRPSGSYGNDYSYYSGATQVDIYVHRKPIAIATLDWDYNIATNTYKTTWVDQSYDLDHNITRALTDKGITDRKIMWQKVGGDWNYSIPDNLSPGTYKLRYYVRDLENIWSDVFTMNLDGTPHTNVTEVTFTLAASPPMQFEAKLRSEKTQFRIPVTPVTLPASENLQLYDIWTRYPSNPILEMSIFNLSNTQVSTSKTVNFTSYTGTKTVNDISWNNISYNTSATLPDGNYIFKVTANSSQSKTISFPFTLSTPINLLGYINGKSSDAQINTGETNVFTFSTSTYVTSTQLKFEDNTYTSSAGSIKLISNNGTIKTWSYTAALADGAYPDGQTGLAEFIAATPSGKSENIYVNYRIVGIKASNFKVTMMLDIGWKSYYFNLDNGIDDNHDGEIDRYPRRSNTDIGTTRLPINYYSLVGHYRNYIKAGYKVKGQIDIQGSPDTASFKINYKKSGNTYSDYVTLIKSDVMTYHFEWIIPLETDSNSFVTFDLITSKGSNTYGNEKWVDTWDSRNLDRKVFFVKGDAYEDITFVQSH